MRPFSTRPTRKSQRGVVLAVVLILLLVMTLLAVASLSGTLLEERMGAAQVDRNLSLQATEATLREAEQVVRGLTDNSTLPDPGEDCAAGLCPMPQAGEEDQQQRWLNDGFWDDDSGTWAEFATDLDGVTAQPRYIIELIDDAVADRQTCTTGGDVSLEANCTLTSRRFRVTVRSQEEGRAAVMLQSIYAVP